MAEYSTVKSPIIFQFQSQALSLEGLFLGIVIGGCASGIHKCLNEFKKYTNLYLDLSCQE